MGRRLSSLLCLALACADSEPAANEGDASTGESAGDGDGDGDCVDEHEPPAGAVAFYDFEGEGDVVVDRTGNGHDGTFQGPSTTRASGRFCQGLYTEGDDAVIIPDSDAFDFSSAYTLEMWVQLPDEQSSPRVHKYSTFTLRASQQSTLSYVAHEPCQSFGGGGLMMFDPQSWHHVAGVWDGAQWIYYIDGECFANCMSNPECMSIPLANDYPLEIGQSIGASTVDDVTIFDHARTPEQICGDARGTWDGVACTLPGPL